MAYRVNVFIFTAMIYCLNSVYYYIYMKEVRVTFMLDETDCWSIMNMYMY